MKGLINIFVKKRKEKKSNYKVQGHGWRQGYEKKKNDAPQLEGVYHVFFNFFFFCFLINNFKLQYVVLNIKKYLNP